MGLCPSSIIYSFDLCYKKYVFRSAQERHRTMRGDCRGEMTMSQAFLPRLRHALLTATLLLAACATTAPPPRAAEPVAALATDTRGVPGIQNAQLDPEYWVRRQAQADRIVLDRAAIA